MILTGDTLEAANAFVLIQREVQDGDALLIERVNGDWPDRWIEDLAKALMYTTPTPGTYEDLKPAAKRILRKRAVAVLDRLTLRW